MSMEVFSQWVDAGQRFPQKYPCAAVIMRYAVDQQGVDLRGSVSGETAWELCGRFLSDAVALQSLSTVDVAQLVVYWLEDGHVPAQMQEAIYEGMVAELQGRGKTVQTETDEQNMKCRWATPFLSTPRGQGARCAMQFLFQFFVFETKCRIVGKQFCRTCG